MLIASVVELGLQVVVLSGIVWVVTGTLNLAFLIAAVAMIMRFADRWRCLSATPRLWN